MNDKELDTIIKLEKLGEVTDEELRELGLSQETINKFRKWQKGPEEEVVESKSNASTIAGLLIILVIIGVCMVFAIGQGDNKKVAPKPATICTLAKYKAGALKAASELSSILSNTDYSEPGSRQTAKAALTGLLATIDKLPCKRTFPLKHETLEYSVRHVLDAIKYTDDGDHVAASNSLDNAILNADRFKNWSVDID